MGTMISKLEHAHKPSNSAQWCTKSSLAKCTAMKAPSWLIHSTSIYYNTTGIALGVKTIPRNKVINNIIAYKVLGFSFLGCCSWHSHHGQENTGIHNAGKAGDTVSPSTVWRAYQKTAYHLTPESIYTLLSETSSFRFSREILRKI
jgi:hypothetical protein